MKIYEFFIIQILRHSLRSFAVEEDSLVSMQHVSVAQTSPSSRHYVDKPLGWKHFHHIKFGFVEVVLRCQTHAIFDKEKLAISTCFFKLGTVACVCMCVTMICFVACVCMCVTMLFCRVCMYVCNDVMFCRVCMYVCNDVMFCRVCMYVCNDVMFWTLGNILLSWFISKD